jgi:predicted SAM-dependent methyltransferase
MSLHRIQRLIPLFGPKALYYCIGMNFVTMALDGLRKRSRLRSRTRAAEKELLTRLASTDADDIRIIIGRGKTDYPHWIPTDAETLDLLKESDWQRYFKPCSIRAILAEHVWEHLSEKEGLDAAMRCWRYLRPGGYLRLAVPDGLMPDPEYRKAVGVGGSGAGAHSHRVLYTFRTLSALLETAGYRVTFLEYFDETGIFHSAPWNSADGHIKRSAGNSRRNPDGVLRHTSLIIDAVKT